MQEVKKLLTQPPSNFWNILFLIAAVFVIFLAVKSDVFQTNEDFHHFYVAAHALLSGKPLYTEDGQAYIYPPFYAFLLTPLTFFSEVTARWICLSINTLLIGLISFLGFRILARGLKLSFTLWQAVGTCSLALLLTRDPLFHEFAQCQDDVLILFGFTVALYCLDRKPVIAGVILGLIADIKYQSLFFLPFLIFRARWLAVIGLIIGIVAGLFLPALMVGWRLNFNIYKLHYMAFIIWLPPCLQRIQQKFLVPFG